MIFFFFKSKTNTTKINKKMTFLDQKIQNKLALLIRLKSIFLIWEYYFKWHLKWNNVITL